MNDYRDYLMHHGIKGMKWGVRRFQNKDGTRTPAGQKRYESLGTKFRRHKVNAIQRDIDSYKPIRNGYRDKKGRLLLSKADVDNQLKGLEYAKKNAEIKLRRSQEADKKPWARAKNIAKGVGTAALLAGAGYGMYKLAKSGKLTKSRGASSAAGSPFIDPQNIVQTKNGPVYYPFGKILPSRGSTAGRNKSSKADAAAKAARIRSRVRQVNGDTHAYNPAWQTARDAHNRKTQSWGKRKWNGSRGRYTKKH